MASCPCFMVHKLRCGVLELDVGSVILGEGSGSTAIVRGVARVWSSKNLQSGRWGDPFIGWLIIEGQEILLQMIPSRIRDTILTCQRIWDPPVRFGLN
jgi:hypothetical protein